MNAEQAIKCMESAMESIDLKNTCPEVLGITARVTLATAFARRCGNAADEITIDVDGALSGKPGTFMIAAMFDPHQADLLNELCVRINPCILRAQQALADGKVARARRCLDKATSFAADVIRQVE